MPVSSEISCSSDERALSVGTDSSSPSTLSYGAVQPYLEYIEDKISKYLSSYSRTFEHVVIRGLSREFHAWTHAGTMSVQLAVATMLNYYRQIMLKYLWCGNIAEGRRDVDDNGYGHVEIYVLINNFETAMWENRLEPLLRRQQYGSMASECNVDPVQDNESIAVGGDRCTQHANTFRANTACISPCDIDCCNGTSEDLQSLMQQSIDDESERKFVQYMKRHGSAIVKGNHNDEDTEHHLSELFAEDYTTSSLSSSDEIGSHDNSTNENTRKHPTPIEDCGPSKRRKRNIPKSTKKCDIPPSVSFQQTATTRFLSIPRTFSADQIATVAKCIADNRTLVEAGQLSTDDALGKIDKILQGFLMQSLDGLSWEHGEVYNIGS